jgi:predicted RNA-binding Zn-ribbon protein involved in translation (DUF1610 family)
VIVEFPAYPWLGLWFACPACGARVRYETADIGTELRSLPKRIEGRWQVSVMCPGCRTTRVLRTEEDA